ncbi:MAG: hypothetical protein GX896_00290 [Clostridiales bacterium]|nr:hypothetical protein [Clostridiales bacterium]
MDYTEYDGVLSEEQVERKRLFLISSIKGEKIVRFVAILNVLSGLFFLYIGYGTLDVLSIIACIISIPTIFILCKGRDKAIKYLVISAVLQVLRSLVSCILTIIDIRGEAVITIITVFGTLPLCVLIPLLYYRVLRRNRDAINFFKGFGVQSLRF